MSKPLKRSFESILVANRGEIACRILRTAKDLGYRTIAVFSEADIDAPHVALADEAALIGPAPANQSYLDIDRVLQAAARTRAEAIHPGYGFLSENPDFARACNKAGLEFIGPSPEAIELMGNKAEAKRRMIAAGVPCVPGYEGQAQDDDTFIEAAAAIGFPVMVKAAAGGGGRGMRLVDDPADFSNALRLARSEAENSFGSAELILEKAITSPRHVEIQVFADRHGNVIHLGERDCSIQRRHQKVVEEAPCPVMTAELREAMGAAAVEAARSIAYEGAGTVEFLLNTEREFYFLEMNTRLQVEHPVTEMVTGLDLVELQIDVARGRPLPVKQKDIAFDGHAIEVRLYAEDPEQDFMPSTGQIELWHPPAGEGIRVDDGIATGGELTPFYDAMVAKIVAWGADRESARMRLLRALNGSALFGLSSNRDFLLSVLQQPSFIDGSATTAFLEQSGLPSTAQGSLSVFHRGSVAAVLDHRAAARRSLARSALVSPGLLNWSSNCRLISHYHFLKGDRLDRIMVRANGNHYGVTGAEMNCVIEVHHDDGNGAEITIDGASHKVIYCTPANGVSWLALEGISERYVNRLAFRGSTGETGGGGRVVAPMHGQLLEVNVTVGQVVQKGQRLLVLEAMKMQHEILSPADGVVTTVKGEAGEQVTANELIIEIEPGED
jgi:geranyl-CoA carboxylase alpha subunit